MVDFKKSKNFMKDAEKKDQDAKLKEYNLDVTNPTHNQGKKFDIEHENVEVQLRF